MFLTFSNGEGIKSGSARSDLKHVSAREGLIQVYGAPFSPAFCFMYLHVICLFYLFLQQYSLPIPTVVAFR
jgi:hypothetical protein